ncbi:MAG: peptide/nickel transport system substrate-binding protein, partial [Chloroflexota bacterium]|nr:peptide/nickel transport system substrate-binding protein [Chloroflexota bacterium]
MLGRIAAILALTSMIIACAQAKPVAETANPAPSAVSQSRTLNVMMKNEPFDLTDTASTRNNFTVAMFLATLTGQENGAPYALLSSVPDLNTDTWRVFPDGTMETTYRLKPGLTWHDGQPLTADDFVFTERLNVARFQMGLSVSSITPAEHKLIQEVSAPASDTVVIRWKGLYADADKPTLKVAPKHILEEPLNQGEPQLLGSNAYWTTGYVGVGPYKLTQWQQGAFIEGTAFDGYALGRPKIDKVIVSWNADPNVVLAGLLGGSTNVAVDSAVQFEQGAILKDTWGKSGDGAVIFTPSENRYLGGQFRPAYVEPKALLDVRVRAATLHAIDRKALADTLLAGEGVISDTPLVPVDPLFAAVDRAITK